MSARLEDIKNGASVRGIASAQPVHVVSVDWIGDRAISVVFRLDSYVAVLVAIYAGFLSVTLIRQSRRLSSRPDAGRVSGAL